NRQRASTPVLAEVRRRFDVQHEQLFGHKAEREVVEIVSYRVVGLGVVPKAELPRQEPASTPVSDALAGERPAYFPDRGGMVACPIYDRARLGPGHEIVGPAIVEQLDSTVVVFPGQRATVDEFLNLLIV